jgi:hypothetical protein
LENLASVFGSNGLVRVLEANAQFKAAGNSSGSERAAMTSVLLRFTTGSENQDRMHHR